MEDKVVPRSLIGQAVKYSLNQEKYLRNYLLDGRLDLSDAYTLSNFRIA